MHAADFDGLDFASSADSPALPDNPQKITAHQQLP
jgi:hypothetical protein